MECIAQPKQRFSYFLHEPYRVREARTVVLPSEEYGQFTANQRCPHADHVTVVSNEWPYCGEELSASSNTGEFFSF